MRKVFGGLVALVGVDIRVGSAEIVGLVGPNGSGKTTFLNVVSGFLRPTGGEILFQGEDTARLGPERLVARGMCRTFQQATAFVEATVMENIAMAMHLRTRKTYRAAATERVSTATREIQEALLCRVRLADKAATRAGDLGLGQQKHLGIAIALATNPTLLLLDEPAAGMGEAEVFELMDLINELRGDGLSLVVVEHNMDLIMGLCDRVAVLDFGSKIAEGPPAAIVADERVAIAYLGRRATVASR